MLKSLQNEMQSEMDAYTIAKLKLLSKFKNLSEKLVSIGFEEPNCDDRACSWKLNYGDFNCLLIYDQYERDAERPGKIVYKIRNPNGFDAYDLGHYYGSMTDDYVVKVMNDVAIPAMKQAIKEIEQQKIREE